MRLKVDRFFRGKDYTIGKLYVNGKYFCDTLEDTDRGLSSSMSEFDIKMKKVKKKTAIPYGVYRVTLNTISNKYSNYTRYSWAKECKGQVPRLIGVKGFEGILIHPGNTPQDTEGCILVGENKVKGKVLDSVATWKKLYAEMKKAADSGEVIVIEILVK